jgi:hypothetical protein
MDDVHSSADGSAHETLRRWLWALAWLALLAWQFWLTLGLFGPEPFAQIADDRFIANGAYPQHLYLGKLGADAFLDRGSSTVFDPAFQVGYLKTPIFNGSRLAEVFVLVGYALPPAVAYKIGLIVVCMLVPVLLLIAARTAGLDHPTAIAATLLGQLVWWGPLGRASIEAGDCEILLASLAGLAHVGCLVGYHRRPSMLVWLLLLLTGCLGWFLQPLLFPIALPLLLAYYLSVGARHDFLTWHTAFWLAEQGAVLVNLPWLVDWVGYWWLRSPLPSAANLVLPHRTLVNVWNAPLWGGPTDRMLTIAMMTSAFAGVIILNQTRQRPAARLFGMGAAGALALALLGISWEPLGQVGTIGLLAPALWFATLPAAHAWCWLARRLWCCGRWGRLALAVTTCALVVSILTSLRDNAACLGDRCTGVQPLSFGLSPQRQAIVDALLQHTTRDARILWEDCVISRKDSRWAAMLPILTDGRSFVGGLDPDATIEPSEICLTKQLLERQPIAEMSDKQLAEYCGRYNIGWVICWSPAVVQRVCAWSAVEKIVPVQDETPGWLLKVNRPLSFARKGKAQLVTADHRFIMLQYVEPENGVVELSLHYQAGMRVTPARVQLEREASGEDFIGFVRLRLAERADCVTITWEK